MLDLLIRNGTVVDGTGGPAYKADVAVKDGKIARIAPNITEDAAKTIDAAGRWVTPGFIDYHSHSDMIFLIGTSGHNYLEQGITTEIAGQCGGSAAPISKKAKWELIDYIPPEKVDELKAACENFTTFTAYVEKMKLPTNMAFYAGQGSIRGRVMGYSPDKPTEAQLEEMRALVAEAMENGFVGLSTGLIYPPSVYAQEDEITELAKVAAKYGGSYVSHIRGESDTVVDAVAEAIRIGENAGCDVIISHHKVAGRNNLGKSATTLKMIEQANERGVRTRADQYPYTAGSTGLISALPPVFATEGPVVLTEKLKDPAFRRTVTAALEKDDFGESLIKYSTFEGCLVLEAAKTPDVVGKNIAEIAKARGTDPYETVYDLIVENEGNVGMAYFMQNQEDMDAIIAHPFVMAGTDASHKIAECDPETVAGLHPRATGTFPRHLRIVRERGLFPIEKAIQRITQMPAETAKLKNVGLLKEGYNADICVIDWENLREHSDFVHPHRRNEGLDYVIVNGQIAAEHNVATGVKAGKLLKSRQ